MTDDLLAQLQKRIDYDRRHYKPDPLLSEVAERIKALEAESERLTKLAKDNNTLARMYKAQVDEFRRKYVAAIKGSQQ